MVRKSGKIRPPTAVPMCFGGWDRDDLGSLRTSHCGSPRVSKGVTLRLAVTHFLTVGLLQTERDLSVFICGWICAFQMRVAIAR